MLYSLNDVMAVILYLLGSILIVVLIILVFRIMRTLDKIDRVVDDVNIKSKKLNGVFDIVDSTADGLSHLSEMAVAIVVNFINGFVSKRIKKEEEEENE